MAAWQSPMGKASLPLTPSGSSWESRGAKTQTEAPQGNAQHGCQQLSMALIYPDGCPAPAGHQNKHLGWSPRWKMERLFFPNTWKWTKAQTQNVGNKNTCWLENRQLCASTCPTKHFYLGPKTQLHPQATCRGFPRAPMGMAAVLKFRINPDSTPCFATSLVFNT